MTCLSYSVVPTVRRVVLLRSTHSVLLRGIAQYPD